MHTHSKHKHSVTKKLKTPRQRAKTYKIHIHTCSYTYTRTQERSSARIVRLASTPVASVARNALLALQENSLVLELRHAPRAQSERMQLLEAVVALCAPLKHQPVVLQDQLVALPALPLLRGGYVCVYVCMCAYIYTSQAAIMVRTSIYLKRCF